MKIHGGYIIIARKLLESPSWQALNEAGKIVMITLLMLANHKPRKWFNPIEKKEIMIERGQCITGRKSLAQKANVGVQSVRTSLTTLKSTNFLTIKSTKMYSIITILKYHTYQNPKNYTNQVTNQVSNQELTKLQPTPNHKQECKNEKNVYKEFVYLTNQEYEKLISAHGEAVTKEYIHKLNNYIGSTGKRYKSHYHTMLNWLSKEPKNKPRPLYK